MKSSIDTSKIKTTTASTYVVGAVANTLFHPVGYAKILIQLGHEPLKPQSGRYWFGMGKETLIYPNIFKYIGHIKRTDGFLGLYRGLFPKIVGGVVGNYVQSCAQDILKAPETTADGDEEGDRDEFVIWLQQFCKQTSRETVWRCCGIIASHPFHVIMIRSMAQFVGGEKEYDGIINPVKEIYRNDGIMGFFAGLMPRILGEVICIWLSNLLTHLVNRYLTVSDSGEMKSYSSGVIGIVVGHLTYPFTLVSNVSAVAGAQLAAARPPNMPDYTSWVDCWRNLSQIGALRRGGSVFFRYYKGPTNVVDGKLVPAYSSLYG